MADEEGGSWEDDDAWGGWGDDRDGEAAGADASGGAAVDPFSGASFASAEECLAHMASAHGADLVAAAAKHKLDQYGWIRMVNCVRKKVAGDPSWSGVPEPDSFSADELYIPVLEDDALLQFDIEAAVAAAGGGPKAEAPQPSSASQGDTVESLREQLELLKVAFAQYRELAEPALLGVAGAADLLDEANTGGGQAAGAAARGGGDDDDDDDDDGKDRGTVADGADDADPYFYSYAHWGIHLDMLRDTVRTEAYRDAMYRNPDTFRGKTVLDVGCGTGILSMMAAKAGAERVIGVDNSSVVFSAMGIVHENGLADKVTLVRGKIEEVELPVKIVDIIVSEWMGYFLFFESMLDSVLRARDRWLAPGGVVYPDRCALHVVALADAETYHRRVGFWRDVYGFNMASMAPQVLREVDVRVVDKAAVASPPALIHAVDIMTAKPEDVEYDTPFELAVDRECTVDALCAFFDVDFAKGCANPVTLPTGPHTQPTHWKQAVMYLEHPVELPKGGKLVGRMKGRRNSVNPRHWDVDLTYSVGGSDAPEKKQKFSLG